MEKTVQIDFFDGAAFQEKYIEVDTLISQMKEAQKLLVSWPIDSIIEVLDDFANRLLERSNLIHRQFPNSGIPYLAAWCQKRQIETLIETSFHDRRHLDTFVGRSLRSKREFRAFPRGLVVHWMAGNVPTLGFLSLIMGLLTKNANIIKVASGSNRLLAALLEQLSETKSSAGPDRSGLMRTMAVIRYDHRMTEINAILSRNADVRIMWGTDESVQSIKAYPAKQEASDLVFPNRTSFIIVGKRVLEIERMDRVTKRIAQDISIFEQKACASPHTIFLATDDDAKVNAFASALKNALQSALRSFPKVPPAEKEVSAILNLRVQYDMLHEAWYSDGTEYTILADDLFQLGPPIGNRTVYLRKLLNIERLPDIITPNVQTVGLAVDQKDFDQITSVLGTCGVHRFVVVGAMTHFDLPWDGYFFPHHLVRWTSRSNNLISGV